MTQEPFKRHIILDTGAFQILTKNSTSQAKVESIVAALNDRRPARIVAIPGLLPQYLGIKRSSWRKTVEAVSNPLGTAWKESPQAGREQLRRCFIDLIDEYEDQVRTEIGSYHDRVDMFLREKVSAIPQAREIATDILTMRGQSLTDDQMASEFAAFYAFDELANHVGPLLYSDGRIQQELFCTILDVCIDYRHLNFYRLIESLLSALQAEARESNKAERKQHFETLRKGVSRSKLSEADDGLWLWLAFQGTLGETGSVPVSVLTFDQSNLKRAKWLEAVLGEQFGDMSILDTLRARSQFIPGEVLVFDVDTRKIKEIHCLSVSAAGVTGPHPNP
jgi:hypothetical protein